MTVDSEAAQDMGQEMAEQAEEQENVVHKNTFMMYMSEETWLLTLAMRYGGDFTRKIASRTETPPTEQEWIDYREAAALLAKLEDSPYFVVDGYDVDVRVDPPQPKVEYEYAETEAEWAARVRTLNPDDYESLTSRLLGQSMSAFAKADNG